MNWKFLGAGALPLFFLCGIGCTKNPDKEPVAKETKSSIVVSKEYSPAEMERASRELRETLESIKSETRKAQSEFEKIKSDIQKAVSESGDQIGRAIAKNAYNHEQKQVEAVIGIDLANDTLQFARLQERHNLLMDEFLAKKTDDATMKKMEANFVIFMADEKMKADKRRQERKRRLMAPIEVRKLQKSFE